MNPILFDGVPDPVAEPEGGDQGSPPEGDATRAGAEPEAGDQGSPAEGEASAGMEEQAFEPEYHVEIAAKQCVKCGSQKALAICDCVHAQLMRMV